jgi:predicted CoA-substrate-specific enzyme activase
VAGVDIGSVATKVALVGGGRVLGRAVVATGVSPQGAAEAALAAAMAEGQVTGKPARVVSTGYGRRATQLQGDIVTEITAAARGAHWLGAPTGPVHTVVDIGGQDTKVILVHADGSVADFTMNDKCAAGTGRFLSLMAHALEVELGELGELSLRATQPVTINATCAVFAESEVVSLIARGRRKEDIVAGIHAAIASRIANMVRQMGGRDVVFTGGGAKNKGLHKALETALGAPVYVPPDPQFVVATGAALIAADKHGRSA